MPEEIFNEAAEAAETVTETVVEAVSDMTPILEKLDELLYHHQLTNTILLLLVGCAAGITVCYILYRFLRKFI